ncbi:hypothetical protein BATDEDRAFT_90238 [Batrachochytrium dendrobatidis JAM81]|uniref:Uncharacterized protein n=2 Tax=Batrachochytrium dendrobatidis TaxID=109871 RepID=F4P713_BATDJ|nr:uncharacterized protein BATDEDRAFT_90238 [Batrachochytrium dendrobatidis JAM81]EGF78968.1 hypothetical protein BATDEDRAFT_90238 [Batrachochytrium dendrobatidis JAM81]KAK5670568.1 hypothetical protein QVD99_002353 [Batrachochytrium dendrobatidis]|eukprot:XP_006680521.1 hypothetical protein BATDEDRAFT_90238 [Batrachochytrium dendrobatidis JAM81]
MKLVDILLVLSAAATTNAILIPIDNNGSPQASSTSSQVSSPTNEPNPGTSDDWQRIMDAIDLSLSDQDWQEIIDPIDSNTSNEDWKLIMNEIGLSTPEDWQEIIDAVNSKNYDQDQQQLMDESSPDIFDQDQQQSMGQPSQSTFDQDQQQLMDESSPDIFDQDQQQSIDVANSSTYKEYWKRLSDIIDSSTSKRGQKRPIDELGPSTSKRGRKLITDEPIPDISSQTSGSTSEPSPSTFSQASGPTNEPSPSTSDEYWKPLFDIINPNIPSQDQQQPMNEGESANTVTNQIAGLSRKFQRTFDGLKKRFVASKIIRDKKLEEYRKYMALKFEQWSALARGEEISESTYDPDAEKKLKHEYEQARKRVPDIRHKLKAFIRKHGLRLEEPN